MAEKNLLLKLLQQHFEEDKISFSSINKTLERHEELMKINGDHMSHIRSDMNEMKQMLKSNSIKIEEDRIKVQSHMEEVKPMLQAYQSDRVIKDSDTQRGDKIIRWSILIGSVGIISSTIMWIFAKLGINIKL